MKKLLVSVIVLGLLATGWLAAGAMNAAEEEAAVRAVVLDYFEGWFGGDVDRFLSALHPELAKRIPIFQDGEWKLHPADREAMADYIRSGRSKRDFEEANIQVKVFDISHDVASAVGSCNTFFDYVHLAKIDGKWWIVNVLWQQYPKEEK